MQAPVELMNLVVVVVGFLEVVDLVVAVDLVGVDCKPPGGGHVTPIVLLSNHLIALETLEYTPG